MFGKLLLISGFTVSLAVNAASEMPLLAHLTEMAGASGFEKPIRQEMEKNWQPLLADFFTA
ncbi:hypothetical protein ELY21_02985 [Legionella sp. km535]|uniref:hypothetical protein n=1 Tax=Legionella sp. km535 TaxID=2498107 RepID=UPI000F8D88BA|nr:hypothetical protein [Legionella sp. km535]RUR20028.1 hypothetical protein ELY21_02985 [Legionella sp. km535]